ncbi:hypothetical protein DFH94DRAFT_103662 [Russula ochroleuca]|uniref:Uncharacterized protein n=1 Tax=Russula ochroleuca TaxID=152965 RepID=A0A9P5MS82_9AGAM|nr:hypothetical protein DFH94DRAFT_103662 [Russula ochroleuca]
MRILREERKYEEGRALKGGLSPVTARAADAPLEPHHQQHQPDRLSHSSRPLGSFSFSSLTIRLPRVPNEYTCNFPGPLRICLSVLLLSLRHTRNSQGTFSRFLTVPACQHFETSVCASSRKSSTSRSKAPSLPTRGSDHTFSRCNNCTCHNRGLFVLSPQAMVPAQWTLIDPSDKDTDFPVASRYQSIDKFQLSFLFLLAENLGTSDAMHTPAWWHLAAVHSFCVDDFSSLFADAD